MQCPNLTRVYSGSHTSHYNLGHILSQFCFNVKRVKYIDPILQLINYKYLDQIKCIHLGFGYDWLDSESKQVILICPNVYVYVNKFRQCPAIKFNPNSKLNILTIINKDIDKFE
jgi:hypothetical protein